MKRAVVVFLIVASLFAGVMLLPFVMAGFAAVTIAAGGSSSGPVGSCSLVADDLAVPGRGGQGELRLSDAQLGHVRTLLSTAAEMEISEQGVQIALMVALQESTLRNLANDSVPESLELQHDGIGSDHDSVGLMQQRANWGTVAERMDPAYAYAAFFGGDAGPAGSPAGLLDIDGWESMDLGDVAQRVQVSAYPDAYDQWERTAGAIIASSDCEGSASPSADGWVTPTIGPISGSFGARAPICVSGGCTPSSHSGTDIAASLGTPVGAAADGTVTYAEHQEFGGWVIMIDHGGGVTTLYAHLLDGSFRVGVGDRVAAGQEIALVGSSGRWTTGAHLHLSVYLDGQLTDPMPFFAARGVTLGAA